MIDRISLENFKSFGKRSEIRLAPLTMLYGQNSAGKSSIIHSLYLLKQSLASDSPTVFGAQPDDSIVNLGSFSDAVFNQDNERTIRIGISVNRSNSAPSSYGVSLRNRVVPRLDTGYAEMEFRRTSAVGYLHAITLYEPTTGKLLVRLEAIHTAATIAKKLQSNQPYDFKVVDFARNTEFWTPFYNWCSSAEGKEHIGKTLGDYIQHWEDLSSEDSPRKFKTTVAREIENLKEMHEFYQSNFTVHKFIARLKTSMGETTLSLHGVSGRSFSGNRTYEAMFENSLEPPRSKKEAQQKHAAPFAPGVQLFNSAAYLGGVFTLLLRETIDTSSSFIGPFREAPKRFQPLRGRQTSSVGVKGENTAELLKRDRKLLERANEWLRRLEIPYSLEARNLGGHLLSYTQILLTDSSRKATEKRKQVRHTLADVGFGISQILPIICDCIFRKNSIIFIEQPELHIHPRLQAHLADLFIWSINERGNQIVAETHSEHLILRVMKRLRQTSEDTKTTDKTFTNKQFVAQYVLKGTGSKGAEVKEINLTSDGKLKDEWPGGFFPERRNELVG